MHHEVCSISFAKVLTLMKVSRVGCALVIVTQEAPTLCRLNTACLVSSYIKVSHLGCALPTVTPEDVLIMGSVGHTVHCGASGA
jgi:hypothetical protein